MQQVSHIYKLTKSLLWLTFENESNSSIRYLNIVLEENDFGIITSVYRKSTFTGEYVRRNSFCLNLQLKEVKCSYSLTCF